MEIPEFSGGYDQWLNFRDTFNSMINSDQTIPDIRRFYYRKGALKGEAAQLLHSLPVSANNYAIAWKLLEDRYENEAIIVNQHVKNLFNMEVLTRESHQDLRCLFDTATQNLRALKMLKQPTEHWDTLMVYLISTKFDNKTKREWESRRPMNTIATMEHMEKFLKARCQFLENLHSSESKSSVSSKFPVQSNKQTFSQGKKQTATFINVNNLSCALCNGNHP